SDNHRSGCRRWLSSGDGGADRRCRIVIRHRLDPAVDISFLPVRPGFVQVSHTRVPAVEHLLGLGEEGRDSALDEPFRPGSDIVDVVRPGTVTDRYTSVDNSDGAVLEMHPARRGVALDVELG